VVPRGWFGILFVFCLFGLFGFALLCFALLCFALLCFALQLEIKEGSIPDGWCVCTAWYEADF